MAGELDGQRPRRLLQPTLRDVVRQRPLLAEAAVDGGDVDDPAVASGDHPRGCTAGEEDRGVEVDREHPAVRVERQVDGERRLEDPCVVDEHVERPDRCLRPGEQRFELLDPGQVAVQAVHRRPEIGNRLDVDRRHLRALGCEPLCDRPADPVRRARDERRTSLEQGHPRIPISVLCRLASCSLASKCLMLPRSLPLAVSERPDSVS